MLSPPPVFDHSCFASLTLFLGLPYPQISALARRGGGGGAMVACVKQAVGMNL